MGKCGSPGEAIQRKSQLEQLGLRSDIIKIHPDDMLHTNADADADREYRQTFGAKVLGSFVGCTEYRQAGVNNYICELQRVAGELLKYPDLQGRWLLFSRCFIHKPVYVFRTVPPEIADH
jgi:hypothetical protein